MKNYLEITLIDNPDINVSGLWGKLFIQLHLALVEQQDQQGKVSIGISFPEYWYELNKGGYLGGKLRVFGQNEIILQQLNLTKWLSRLTDYIHCTGVREAPSNQPTKYVQYRRQHIKGSLSKLARRHAKRHQINLDEAVKLYPDKVYVSDLPYIQLQSLTTQQPFRIYIQKHERNKLVQEGFGTYGLSCSSIVPEF